MQICISLIFYHVLQYFSIILNWAELISVVKSLTERKLLVKKFILSIDNIANRIYLGNKY